MANISPNHAPSEISLRETRGIIKDLFEPSPLYYWTDFLLTTVIGMGCYATVRRVEMFSALQLVCFVVSCLAFYRMAMFIHELVHLRKGTFTVFRFVWNLLCGIPFLMPSFVYYTHVDHHRRKHYGTERDGEYRALGHRPPLHIVLYLLESFLIPFLVVIRFFLITPITWFSPAFRDWVHRHASSMVMDPSYIRSLPGKKELAVIRLQEFMCFLWCLGIAVVPPLFMDRWPIPFLIHAYCTSVFIIFINSLRTLGAHRWTNAGGEMSFLGQLLDSVNYPQRPWITELWGPVGTRYHALHHLFPSLPYHQMRKAHQRLMKELPADSPYRKTNRGSLLETLGEIWEYSVRNTQGTEAHSTSDGHQSTQSPA